MQNSLLTYFGKILLTTLLSEFLVAKEIKVVLKFYDLVKNYSILYRGKKYCIFFCIFGIPFMAVNTHSLNRISGFLVSVVDRGI